MKTWNRQRKRTRDRLLEYYLSAPLLNPQTTIIDSVYPWHNYSLAMLSRQIYQLAVRHGFNDTEPKFWEKFAHSDIAYGALSTFPIPGNTDRLYLDTETDILYYFKQTTAQINIQQADLNGVEIVGHSDDGLITYLYIPVKALPIEDLIINSGTAAEYID